MDKGTYLNTDGTRRTVYASRLSDDEWDTLKHDAGRLVSPYSGAAMHCAQHRPELVARGYLPRWFATNAGRDNELDRVANQREQAETTLHRTIRVQWCEAAERAGYQADMEHLIDPKHGFCDLYVTGAPIHKDGFILEFATENHDAGRQARRAEEYWDAGYPCIHLDTSLHPTPSRDGTIPVRLPLARNGETWYADAWHTPDEFMAQVLAGMRMSMEPATLFTTGTYRITDPAWKPKKDNTSKTVTKDGPGEPLRDRKPKQADNPPDQNAAERVNAFEQASQRYMEWMGHADERSQAAERLRLAIQQVITRQNQYRQTRQVPADHARTATCACGTRSMLLRQNETHDGPERTAILNLFEDPKVVSYYECPKCHHWLARYEGPVDPACIPISRWLPTTTITLNEHGLPKPVGFDTRGHNTPTEPR